MVVLLKKVVLLYLLPLFFSEVLMADVNYIHKSLCFNDLFVYSGKGNFLSLPIQLAEVGLKTEMSCDTFPIIDDERRFTVRDKTKMAVLECLGYSAGTNYMSLFDRQRSIPEKVHKWFDHVELYEEGEKIYKPENLLGRFDVLRVPCTMDYDADWNPWCRSDQKRFYVHHGAAINIGESDSAQDYEDYCYPDGSLNEEEYVCDMGGIIFNLLTAQKESGVTEAVWFPFGMGAFLRHLKEMDPSYNSKEKLFLLREKIAMEFIVQFERVSGLNIYLCLPCGGAKDESTENFNAFIHAIALIMDSSFRDRIKICINCDATTVAQGLANELGEYKVSLVNGANRNLIGNQWFGAGARTAIDENFHRRSVMASVIAYLLNNGEISSDSQREDELKQRIESLRS